MKIKLILSAVIISLSSFSVIAGSGHDHGHSHAQPVSAETAQMNAKAVLSLMVKDKVLEESWKMIKANPAERKGGEWLVLFVNDKAADPKKKTLYVFLTASGEYVAANFTGK
jgi:hypothetical protein